MALVEIERFEKAARLWLNRPEQHNALNADMARELADACHALAHDDAVRVVILAGRGASFCAGADIAAMKASASSSHEDNLAEAQRLGGMFAALGDLPKPIVARIQGNVFGGGVGLICACDIAVASTDTTFALSEVRLGIIPALISPYVVRRLGDRGARELMLTGERIGATRALELGLVNHVVKPEELDAKVSERALALLQGGPQAQRRIKLLLELWADSTWEEYRAALPRTLSEVRSSPEAKEGLGAFLEKRKPSWQT
jgi:methylglutaconyl-CoA hydratase